jgi:Ribonuclease G/E
MTYNLLVESCPWHRRAALFDDRGRLLSLRLDDVDRPLITGAVVYGRVRAVEPSLGAAFVDIGDASDGFLPLESLPDGDKLTEGQGLMVRVTRSSFGEKGTRLAAALTHKAPGGDAQPPVLVTPAPNAITRALHDADSNTVLGWVPDDRLVNELKPYLPRIQTLEDNPTDLLDRLDMELDAMLSPRPTWQLPTGNVVVEITSAVATIDVNAGTGPGLKNIKASDAQLALNLAAAEEVARLCRLLDLGGAVVVDFITSQQKNHRQLITDHLEASFATSDHEQVEVQRMSRAGLVEIIRRRQGPSLTLLLKTPLFVAGRILLELWRQPVGGNRRELTVICAPAVADILKVRLTQTACLTYLGRPVTIRADGALPVVDYKIAG